MLKKSFLKGFLAKNAVRNDFTTAKHHFDICRVLVTVGVLGSLSHCILESWMRTRRQTIGSRAPVIGCKCCTAPAKTTLKELVIDMLHVTAVL
jgi:hypothetical protein